MVLGKIPRTHFLMDLLVPIPNAGLLYNGRVFDDPKVTLFVF
jgi:hypothetical protein